jgi:hypothetical protein
MRALSLAIVLSWLLLPLISALALAVWMLGMLGWARPTGNITGFSNLEFSLIGKWLQILKEAVPGVRQAAFMISTANASSPKWYETFNAAAQAAIHGTICTHKSWKCPLA